MKSWVKWLLILLGAAIVIVGLAFWLSWWALGLVPILGGIAHKKVRGKIKSVVTPKKERKLGKLGLHERKPDG